MPLELSESQRGIVQMLSTMALLIAATQVPPDMPYRGGVVLVLGILSVAGMGLQKFLQASPQEQSAILDLVQKYLAMPPEKQQELIAYLPKILPLLQAVTPPQPAIPPQPLP